MKNAQNDNSPIAEEFPAKIMDGEYDAMCYETETGKSFGGRRDIFIKFRIYEGEYDGTVVIMVCTYPKGKMRLRFKYYQQWVLANGGPPKKSQRLTRKVFLHRMFKIKVRTTKRNYTNTNNPLPDNMQYSVVDTIIKPLTGGGE